MAYLVAPATILVRAYIITRAWLLSLWGHALVILSVSNVMSDVLVRRWRRARRRYTDRIARGVLTADKAISVRLWLGLPVCPLLVVRSCVFVKYVIKAGLSFAGR